MKIERLRLRGFTLVELLIVIAIIGILATVVLPAVNEARDKALVAATITDIDSLKSAMEILYNDTGVYPNGQADKCQATPPANNEVDLSSANAGILTNGAGWGGWNGPYAGGAVDKWGTPYFLDEDYDCTAAMAGCRNETVTDVSVLVSCGPDRDTSGSGGSCAYNDDNIVYRLCD